MCLALIGARLFAFELVVAAAAMVFSGDGIVEGANRRALSVAVLGAAALAGLAGAFLTALASPAWRPVIDAVATWDSLRRLGFVVPNPYVLLGASTVLGLIVIGGYLASRRLGGMLGRVYRKEGVLELATVALEIAAVVWCCIAAVRFRGRLTGALRVAPLLFTPRASPPS